MKLFLSAVITLVCSASYAFHTQTKTEIRDSETWVNMTVEVSAQARADVLFVIDDSGSMSTHQANLATQTELIADGLAFYNDVNSAIITSSVSINGFKVGGGGKFVGPVLNSLDADFALNLKKQINVGISGDPTEAFFDPIYLATTEPLLSTTNAGFLRPDADLILVLLTDTEDQSTVKTGPDLWAHLQGLKPNNKISVISVGIIDPKTCMGENAELEQYTLLKEFVTLAKGQTVDLCSDFSTEIPKAISIIKNSVSEIVLQAFPSMKVDFASVTVKADGKALVLGDLIDGWMYDSANSKIILGSAVVANKAIKEVQISYKMLPL